MVILKLCPADAIPRGLSLLKARSKGRRSMGISMVIGFQSSLQIGVYQILFFPLHEII